MGQAVLSERVTPYKDDGVVIIGDQKMPAIWSERESG